MGKTNKPKFKVPINADTFMTIAKINGYDNLQKLDSDPDIHEIACRSSLTNYLKNGQIPPDVLFKMSGIFHVKPSILSGCPENQWLDEGVGQ